MTLQRGRIDSSPGIVSALSAMMTLKVDSRIAHAAVTALGGSDWTLASARSNSF